MRSRVLRVRGGTWSRVGGLTRGSNAVLRNLMSNSNDSISHLVGGASNSDGTRSCRADMRGDGNLCMGKVMDLVQTHTSTTNDVASNSVRNGESCSDAWLIHGGDGIDCLLGAMCRHQHSARVPAAMRRVGPRISQWARGHSRAWGSGGNCSTKEVGSKCRVIMEDLTEVLTNHNELLAGEGCWVCQHHREGQSRKVGWWQGLEKAVAKG